MTKKQKQVQAAQKPTMKELAWFLSAPDSMFRVAVAPNGSITAVMSDRGRTLLGIEPQEKSDG